MTDQTLRAPALAQALAAADLAYSDPGRARHLASAALVDADAEVHAAALRALGMAAAASGDLSAAARTLRQAAAVAEKAGLPVRAGEARGSLAYVLLLQSGARAALAELDRADAVLTDGRSAARLQMQRGLVLSEIRRFDEAAASLRRALLTLERSGGEDLLEADIRNNRAIVHLGTRNWNGAHDELRRAEALYERSGHLGRTAMTHHNRAIVDALRGELPAALSAFDESAARYRAAGMDPGLLPVDRAEALLGVHLVAEAREAAQDAVEEFARRRNAVDLVQARLLLAEAALLDDDPATAAAEAGRARRSARRQGRPRWAALAGHLRLQAAERAGEISPTTVRSAIRVADELADSGWLVQSLDARIIGARAALALGRSDLARAQLSGLGTARRTGPAAVRVRAWHAEAILRFADGEHPAAARAVRAGLEVFEQFQASLGATDLRTHVFADVDELAGLGLALAVASGRPTAILAAAERGRAGALRHRAARPPDDAELAADLAELRQLVTELRSDEIGTAAPAARRRALERSIRDRARHAGGSRGDSGPPSVVALRTALASAALVEFFELDGDLHALTLAADHLSVRRLGRVEVIASAVDELRTGLSWLAFGVATARAGRAVAALVERNAQVLDDLLFDGPVRDGVAASPEPLVIVPTGVLHALPWSALPTCAGRPVSVAPSAALWHRAMTATRLPGRTVLAHGPDLPFAADEVAELAAGYPAALSLIGADAHSTALLEALEGAGIAHLAAHGVFRADNPMFSHLRFADGPLTVYDLERLDSAPELVVLAACDAGLAEVGSGDGLIGLASALLGMGTRALIAAALPVPDEASRALMLRLHEHLRAGHGPADALHRARAEQPDDPASLVAASGFVCFGAG